MRTMWPILIVVVLAAIAALLLTGCNTVEGIGRDIEAIGQGASEVAKDANPYEGEKK